MSGFFDFFCNARKIKTFDFTGGSLPPGLTFTRASSATYYNSSGLIAVAGANAPRFDYDPATLLPLGYLNEGAGTNLVDYSVPDAHWSYGKTTGTINSAVAPDSTTTATYLQDDLTLGQHNAIRTVTNYTSGVTYAISVFAKLRVGEQSCVQVNAGTLSFTGLPYADFDLSAGTYTVGGGNSPSASMKNIGNGWYRCTLIATCDSTTSSYVGINLLNNNPAGGRAYSYTGTGTGLYIWGAQVEVGSFATSYIPTNGSIATRAVDRMSTSNIPWYNPKAGSIVVKGSFEGFNPSSGTDQYLAAFSDGTTNNRLFIRYLVSTSKLGAAISLPSTLTTGFSVLIDTGYTYALSYSPAGNNAAMGGVLDTLGTWASAAAPTGINVLNIGDLNAATARPGFCHVKSFTYYNYALSPTQLQALST